MTQRLLIGNKGGVVGLWLTRAGIDVFSASVETDFLISPDFKNVQIITSGFYALGPSASTTIYYPDTYPSSPMVYFQSGFGSYNRSPLGLLGGTSVLYGVNANCGPSAVTFTNPNSGSALYGSYLVFAKGL